ncbi:MAG: DUF362 domain-containing protein [Methanoregula sp.]
MRTTDASGSPVAGVRMDPAKAYAEIPRLLQQVINEADSAAWDRITEKIDYICVQAGHCLEALDRETGFLDEVRNQVHSGKQLVFKPNLVGPSVIDPAGHGEGPGALICTDWSVIAALMRWFHDTGGIPYHRMAVAEASTSGFVLATVYSGSAGHPICTEAVFEGKSGDFYGGWGFYFARKYLASRHPADHTDDPMRGYDESVSGTYLPPGKAGDRLMIYDINKAGDLSRGRTIPVPEGANFSEVTLHKVITGGDPSDPADRTDYPGCVLVNVPKLKIHAQDLITNAIKNLGIGLYPTRCPADGGGDTWKYAVPAGPNPSFKAKLPHMPWVVEIDEKTHLPVRDRHGAFRLKKTAGMPGTQADVIRAVQAQGVMMVHISDAIDIINLNHNPEGIAVRIPEGYLWSSLDCVALDHLCARYCFKTVPMAEGLRLKEQNGWPTEFVRHVPVARVQGKEIVTVTELDSPLFRYNLYRYAEGRGVGSQDYFVTGLDSVTRTPLASLDGHLGRIESGVFTELITTTMYHNLSCLLWDLQRTILSYAEANDRLFGTAIYQQFMNAFDENGDGVIDYDENGKLGFWTPAFAILAGVLDTRILGEYGDLKGSFDQAASYSLRYTRGDWNSQNLDFARDYLLLWIASAAFSMANQDTVFQDTHVPGMHYGKGMWPSWECAAAEYFRGVIYGGGSLETIAFSCLYGAAFCYADKITNNGRYTGSTDPGVSDPRAIAKYCEALEAGAPRLDFVVFVPEGEGFRNLAGKPVPNVTESRDPSVIFTARFRGGEEIW